MTNNNGSVASQLYEQQKLLRRNLRAKGVTVNNNQSLTNLIDEVSSIGVNNAPVLTGFQFDTSISISMDSNVLLDTVTHITGVLSAFRDDISSDNVDFTGTLSNATVKIYNNNTLIGTCVTDTNGEYDFPYTPTSSAQLNITAIFEGNNDYENCNSNTITRNIINYDGISLSSDKNLISYYSGESTILSAQLLDNEDNPVTTEGISIDFIVDNTSLGTADTDNQGIATLEYTATGYGDMSITATDGSIESDTVEIEDVWNFIQSPARNGFNFGSNFPTPVIITMRLKGTGSWGGTRIYGTSRYVYIRQNSSPNDESAIVSPKISNSWQDVKVVLNNGLVEVYFNDVLNGSASNVTMGEVGGYGGSNANPVDAQNIKIKKIN
jgi:hypothetical protein